jgi:hypothetical protein
MVFENDGGAAWTEADLRGWLLDAGLEAAEVRRGGGPIAVLRARAPGPPRPTLHG